MPPCTAAHFDAILVTQSRQEWLGDGDGHHHLNSSAGRPLWLKRPARWKTEGKTIVSAASVLTALPVKVAIT